MKPKLLGALALALVGLTIPAAQTYTLDGAITEDDGDYLLTVTTNLKLPGEHYGHEAEAVGADNGYRHYREQTLYRLNFLKSIRSALERNEASALRQAFEARRRAIEGQLEELRRQQRWIGGRAKPGRGCLNRAWSLGEPSNGPAS